jgi:hypothetical protein
VHKMEVTGVDVLNMLRPDGGWSVYGNDYENIQFISCDPVSREDFESGFSAYPAWKLQQESAKAAKVEAALQKLEQLGLTREEIQAIL